MHNLLNEHEAAEYLRCSVALLRKWRTAGNTGPAFVKIGSLVRYAVEDLEVFVAANRVGVGR